MLFGIGSIREGISIVHALPLLDLSPVFSESLSPLPSHFDPPHFCSCSEFGRDALRAISTGNFFFLSVHIDGAFFSV
jgi:hypothetical protein